jgi:two-component system KDP operon response regulator KdpE
VTEPLAPTPRDQAPSGPRILVVEDDAATRRQLAAYLRSHGYRVIEAADAATASAAWLAGRPDLIVLDLGLPDRDGQTLIVRWRREATTPILVISARDREAEKVTALDRGADDYVTKPFSPAELLARVRALLRRAAGPAADPEGVVRLGRLELDPVDRSVRVAGRPVALTPREYEVSRSSSPTPDGS